MLFEALRLAVVDLLEDDVIPLLFGDPGPRCSLAGAAVPVTLQAGPTCDSALRFNARALGLGRRSCVGTPADAAADAAFEACQETQRHSVSYWASAVAGIASRPLDNRFNDWKVPNAMWQLPLNKPGIATVLLRDIFGNPFRPVILDPSWRTPTVARFDRCRRPSRPAGDRGNWPSG